MFAYYLLLVILISIATFVYYLKKKNEYWKNQGIPSAKPVLLFGNIKNAVLRKENMAEILKRIYNDFPNEPIVGMYRMTSPCILIRDLDIIKHVMIKDFEKFEDRGVEYSKEGLGANLFHADGETWRVLRSKFTPLFTTAKLKNMIYLINERGDVAMNHLDTTHSVECDISKQVKNFTISTIMTCAFGLEMDTYNDTIMETLLKIDKLTLNSNIFHEIDMMFPGILKVINSSVFPTDVQTFFYKMVSDVVSKRNGVPSGRNDLMDLMLELKQQGDIALKRDSKDALHLKITESVIAAQTFIFYIGGYETSASILALFFFEIAKNPDVQEKVIEEIDNVLQKHEGNVTYETIQDTPYMDKVFHEVNRKYPIIPLLRKSNEDYKIPGTKYTIKKDTVVLVSPFGIHYDEKYYPDPEKFDPERFSQENIKTRHQCAQLAFGVGPRNCIGIRFAKIQTRVFAMKFLSKYRVEPSDKTKSIRIDPLRLIITPLGGVYVNVVPRKKDQ